ncbi:MAG TPA: pyridoxamine 5'-phosphate oxidase family protein [Acidimicrobiales bacterium]|nr:pyridoxamine 5'-phosphate oxidase family protein [Acidimicrobiales bacterium]
MIEEMSPGEVKDFVLEQKVGRLGCHAEGETYVVPVIFAWRDDCFYVYTTEGKKVEMMRANAQVCFEVDEYLMGGRWRSVIVQGTYEELRGEEAGRALEIISERFSSSTPRARDDDRGAGRAPVAFLIRVKEITGRKVERD